MTLRENCFIIIFQIKCSDCFIWPWSLSLTASTIALQISEEHECNDEVSQEDEGFMGMSPLLQAHHAMERMEEFVCKVRWQFLVIPVLYT